MVRTALSQLGGLGLLLGSCLGLAGCSQTPEKAPGKSLPTVTVSYPLQREVTDYQDYTGRTAAVDSVQVQARVTGYLEKICFTEGAEVTEGTVLYEIDPRSYQDAVAQAEAQIRLQEAQLKYNQATYERNLMLYKTSQAASLETVQQDVSQVGVTKASLDAAKANAAQARLNLNWTKVTAPVEGRVGRLLLTRGNLIVANQTTLTTVVRQDPMWVYFDMDEPTWLQIGELAGQGKFGPASPEHPPKIPFHLQLANEKGYSHEATLDFVNNQLDQATATLLIRAIFANPKPANGPRLFAPNNFVRVRVPTSGSYQALLVNPEALGTDQDLKYVVVVGDDNKVVRHNVKLGSLQDGLQVVTEGLRPGERVVVKGLQRIQQGATVEPKLVPMPMPPPGSVPVLRAPSPPVKNPSAAKK
jgi:RND family efflux transporter MFP subunit